MPLNRVQFAVLLRLVAIALIGSKAFAQDSAERDFKFFENEVRPILVKRCYECHSEEAGKRKGGLWLDRKAGWLHGGDSGEAIVPGNVEDSLLTYTIRYEDPSLQMPPKNRLPKTEIAILEKWIATGAADPRDQAMDGAVREGAIDYESAKRYWAFRPLSSIKPPVAESLASPTSGIDRFVKARLQTDNLSSAKQASPRHLIRRLFYDLTGLPPTANEVSAFVSNHNDQAFQELVDELLSRKSFGEKWGKHWLDVARYADSNGGDRNFTFFQAWRYRNYVIDAFNHDKPYYDFVREQIAGDLLPSQNDAQRSQQLIASTFVSLGPKMLTERDKEKLWMDTVDEQIDTTGRAFLGLTLGCARCHDHKFDPISQKDYYALAGIFRSTEVVMGTRNGCVNVASWVEQPLPGKAREKLATKIKRLEMAMRLTVEKVYNEKSGNAKPDKQSSRSQLPWIGIIVDNPQAELVGKWRTSNLSSVRFGKDYLVSEDKNDKATFRASLSATGEYLVRISYSSGPSRRASVPVEITNHQTTHSKTLNETQTPDAGGLFQTIGRFQFSKDSTCEVTIYSGTSKGYLIVDAVQFIPVNDVAREQKAIKAKGAQVDSLLTKTSGELKSEISRLLKELQTADLAMAPRDIPNPADCNLRIRGEVSQLGPKILRGFPKALTDEHQASPAKDSSGRLELAAWMTRPENSLLDRVAVNRIWHHLLGRGIVSTVDNFGRLGQAPTHPELLDWLALRFRKSNGSIKSVVRDIVLSQTYQQSCDHDDSASDPHNQLFGRQNRRRLSAEEIRDTVLFLSGTLDQSVGTATASKFGVDLDKPMSFEKNLIRTVYLPVARNNAVAEMALFDAANPDLVDGARPETTVPTQALYLLNSEFVQSQSKLIAAKTPTKSPIKWLYETILSRPPTPQEVARAKVFIAEFAGEQPDPDTLKFAQAHFAHLLIASTEFLFLD